MKVITTHVAMKKDMGTHGNLFGGIMMTWIDEAAATYAMEVCHTPNMVTVRVNELIFKKKVKEGVLIKIYARVSSIGKTSITFKMEARKMSVYSHEEEVVVSTDITFVRLDEGGDPVHLPSPVLDKYKSLSKYINR